MWNQTFFVSKDIPLALSLQKGQCSHPTGHNFFQSPSKEEQPHITKMFSQKWRNPEPYFRLFWGGGGSLHKRIHTSLYRWGFLHFRYLKCLVTTHWSWNESTSLKTLTHQGMMTKISHQTGKPENHRLKSALVGHMGQFPWGQFFVGQEKEREGVFSSREGIQFYTPSFNAARWKRWDHRESWLTRHIYHGPPK